MEFHNDRELPFKEDPFRNLLIIVIIAILLACASCVQAQTAVKNPDGTWQVQSHITSGKDLDAKAIKLIVNTSVQARKDSHVTIEGTSYHVTYSDSKEYSAMVNGSEILRSTNVSMIRKSITVHAYRKVTGREEL